MLTVADVENAVRKIYELRGDDEAAHAEEDKLHQTVLKAIAEDRCDDPQRCAGVALRTQGIEFQRWCA